MLRKNKLRLLSALFLCGFTSSASGVLKIEITQGIQEAAPIAVVPFGWEGVGSPPEDMAAIISSDLARSGQFAPLPPEDLLARPQNAAAIRFQNWKALGLDNLVIGEVRSTEPDRYSVQFQLFDVFKESQLAGFSFPVSGAELRHVAHQISDIIYKQLTGARGAFNTLIAYVSTIAQGSIEAKYTLQLADSDGHNPKTILESKDPLMSPAWSPAGDRIAYVSFEGGVPAIYVQDVKSAQRQKISAFKGINGAPVWAPDGQRLAVTLSRTGNPDVYTLNIGTGQLTQLTQNRAIDTEPVWTPDGESIIFTSDRSGRPQLYEVRAVGGRPKRLTFEGDYNANAAVSPDGQQIAMVHRDQQNYRIAILDRESGLLRVLTNGRLDESPSFAPNGSMIIYATEESGKGVLGAVSVDGRVKQRLSLAVGDVREPVWSPYLK